MACLYNLPGMRLFTSNDPVEGMVIMSIAKRADEIRAKSLDKSRAIEIANAVGKLFKR